MTIASSTSRISRFVRVPLVVEDVAAGERRLVQVPDERLLLQRQRLKAVGVQLHDGRIVDALEQVRPVDCCAAGAKPAGAGVFAVSLRPQAAVPTIVMTAMILFNISNSRSG